MLLVQPYTIATANTNKGGDIAFPNQVQDRLCLAMTSDSLCTIHNEAGLRCLRRKGRIPEHIWDSWRNGINQYLKNPAIKEVFYEEKTLWKSSYYGFFDEIK